MSPRDLRGPRWRRALRSIYWSNLSWDDFSILSVRRAFYLVLIIIAIGVATNIILDVIAVQDQERNAATIRELGGVDLRRMTVFSGGRSNVMVHCVTIDDPATLELIADTLTRARAGINPERTISLYDFTFSVSDTIGRTVNLRGTVRSKYQQDVFIDFIYSGPPRERELDSWQFPVVLQGFAPSVREIFEVNKCPPRGPGTVIKDS